MAVGVDGGFAIVASVWDVVRSYRVDNSVAWTVDVLDGERDTGCLVFFTYPALHP